MLLGMVCLLFPPVVKEIYNAECRHSYYYELALNRKYMK